MNIIYRLQDEEFEWEDQKARLHQEKHGISFEEATEAFFDPFYQVGDASIPAEQREFLIGYSSSLRLLLVVHAHRSERVRIISARPATRAERKLYESG